MGHSSIQVTVDTYGHLIPGGNIAWVDALDPKTSRQQNATPAQQDKRKQIVDVLQVIDKTGRPGEIRTPDPRFRKNQGRFYGVLKISYFLIFFSRLQALVLKRLAGTGADLDAIPLQIHYTVRRFELRRPPGSQ